MSESDYKKKYLLMTAQYTREIDECEELLKLIRDDLRMRGDEEGVINISGFIWLRLNEWLER